MTTDTIPTPAPKPAKAQKPQKTKGPIPARQGNGYYANHTTGSRLRSVTTILGGGIPKESLIFWAAGVCVDAAIDAIPQLAAASRDPNALAELARWLKRAHTAAKEERADLGSAVHRYIEAQVLGEPVPQELLDDADIAGHLRTFDRFVDEWEVTFTASEMVVANESDGWAGTLDYMVRSAKIAAHLNALEHNGQNLLELWGARPVEPDQDIMGDTKTGGSPNRITSAGHVHGVYPEAGLQMSAYRKGEVAWLRDGTQVPMPPTADVGIVLHLHSDSYRIYPANAGDDLYRYFRHAQMIDEFTSKIASAVAKPAPVIGPALGRGDGTPLDTHQEQA